MEKHFQPDILKDLHVVVTGGGTGLGRSMAMRFAELGAAVTIGGRRPEPLAETVTAIREAGGRAEGIELNIREVEAVEAFIAEAEKRQGNVTRLVNNAAGNFLAPTDHLSPNGFDAIVKTNLYGSFYATQAVGKRWIERQEKGAIISITTTYTQFGSAFLIPSAASKAGIEAMTKSLAAEWGCYGIRLNCIAPGPFPTPGAWERLVPDPKLEAKMMNRIPLKRHGEHRELTDLATFLISDVSSYCTGAVFTIDGGEVLTSGGEFNFLTELPREQMLAAFSKMRK